MAAAGLALGLAAVAAGCGSGGSNSDYVPNLSGLARQRYDLVNDGVGIGKVSSRVPKSIVAKVQQVRQQIVSGKIANIPDTVAG